MEQYKEFYSKHLNCKADLMTLYVDKEGKCAMFLCCKCQQDYIKINQEWIYSIKFILLKIFWNKD